MLPAPITRETALPGGWGYAVMRKVAMAISGWMIVAFLYGHWAGNTALLDGERAFNDYQLWLQSHPILHYGVWFIIASALLAHLAVGPRHWLENRRARPVRYRKKTYLSTTWAARSMMASGAVLLLFVVVHISQVNGWIAFSGASSVYENLQAGFERWPVVALYLLAQVALGLHLYHGLWAQFQTLGIHHPRYNRWRRPFAVVVGVSLAILNTSLVLLNIDGVRWFLGLPV